VPESTGETSALMNSKLNSSTGKRNNDIFQNIARVEVPFKTVALLRRLRYPCTGPEGSRRLRLPDFKTVGT
jgi:hypothetical protein